MELAQRFGKWGSELYDLARGVDERPVRVKQERKSVSKETTFRENQTSLEAVDDALQSLLVNLGEALAGTLQERQIKSLVVKLKFADFETTTAEKAGGNLERVVFGELLQEAWQRGQGRAVRLLGVGVKFVSQKDKGQLELGL